MASTAIRGDVTFQFLKIFIIEKNNNLTMGQISYNVGELRRIIKESANEFKPVIGPEVVSDNKRNNDKSYKDAEKAAKDFDGGLTEPKKGKLPDKMDGNRTTLGYNPRTEVSKEQKENISAQAQGYTSKLEKDNKIEKGGAEFDNDGNIEKNFEDAEERINAAKEELAKSGLQGSKIKTPKKNTMFENKSAKRLTFKRTKFINEAQMLARIPEEYKVDGQRIFMKDACDNEYVVECVKSEKSGLIETNVVAFKNDRLMNEQVDRAFALMDYKSSKEFAAKPENKINEGQAFKNLLDITRAQK